MANKEHKQIGIPESSQFQEIVNSNISQKTEIKSQDVRNWSYQPNKAGTQISSNGSLNTGNLFWNRFAILTSFESGDGWVTNHTSTGGATFTNNMANCNIFTGSTSGSRGRIYISTPIVTTGWDKNPAMQIIATLQSNSGQTAYIGMGDTANAATTGKFIAFKIVNDTIYAAHNNGNGEITTNLSVKNSNLSVTNPNAYQFIFNSGKKIDFYINKQLLASHSTNLPTGNSNTNPIVSLQIVSSTAGSKELSVANVQYYQDI